MPKTTSSDYVQLSFNLDTNLGKPIRFQMDGERIGGNLLPILSKGLYTNPRHCVREYVQNAVDASAEEVTIKVTANSVIISDDGEGMTLEQLLDARDFAISGKDSELHVGFRGIGIYSGFDLCNRLLITSKTRGEEHECVLAFDFKAMKEQLAAERSRSRSERTPLTELITRHSTFQREPDPEEVELHYTVVQLEEVSPVHIAALSDRKELRKYVLKTLPIDFHREFPARDELRKALAENVQGYSPVTVVLQDESQNAEIVVRPVIPDLGRPSWNIIRNVTTKQPIAFYWSALYQGGRQRIPDQYADFRGLVYKVKGFTIGDASNVKKDFPKRGGGTHFEWHTGEIFVLDPEVIPNTERDDFEANSAKQQLEAAVRDVLVNLDRAGEKHRTMLLAEHRFEEAAKNCQQWQVDAAREDKSALELYRQMGGLKTDLDNRKSKVRKGWKASTGLTKDEVIEAVSALEESILQRINRPSSIATSTPANNTAPRDESVFPEESPEPSPDATITGVRENQLYLPGISACTDPRGYPRSQRTDEIKGPLPERPSIAEQPGGAGAGLTAPPSGGTPSHVLSEPTSQTDQVARTMLRVMEEAGWPVEGECATLVEAIDSCATDVLVAHPDLYEDFLDAIADRIASETMG